MVHHTKTKGDLAVGRVITDLLEKGFVPYISFSEHQPFDLLAVSTSLKVLKLQVKYSTLSENQTAQFWICHKQSETRYSAEEVDFFAVYVQEKQMVLYVPNSVTNSSTVSIRFEKTQNNQLKNVRYFADYLTLPS